MKGAALLHRAGGVYSSKWAGGGATPGKAGTRMKCRNPYAQSPKPPNAKPRDAFERPKERMVLARSDEAGLRLSMFHSLMQCVVLRVPSCWGLGFKIQGCMSRKTLRRKLPGDSIDLCITRCCHDQRMHSGDIGRIPCQPC